MTYLLLLLTYLFTYREHLLLLLTYLFTYREHLLMKFAPQTAEVTGNGYAAESSKDNIVVAQPSARYVL